MLRVTDPAALWGKDDGWPQMMVHLREFVREVVVSRACVGREAALPSG